MGVTVKSRGMNGDRSREERRLKMQTAFGFRRVVPPPFTIFSGHCAMQAAD